MKRIKFLGFNIDIILFKVFNKPDKTEEQYCSNEEIAIAFIEKWVVADSLFFKKIKEEHLYKDLIEYIFRINNITNRDTFVSNANEIITKFENDFDSTMVSALISCFNYKVTDLMNCSSKDLLNILCHELKAKTELINKEAFFANLPIFFKFKEAEEFFNIFFKENVNKEENSKDKEQKELIEALSNL